jgi:hypothetical protein
MASGVYPSAFNDAFKGNIDYDTDTFYAMLLTNAYTPDFDAHIKRSSLTASEASGTGYSSGGVSVTVTVSAYDTANNRQELSLGGFTLTTATITARYCAYYKRRGGADTADELVGLNDFGSDKTATAGNFVVAASTLRVTLN